MGSASAVLGVLFALGQHDLKRLLAYHSIENIGIILIGFGVALVGTAANRPEWIVLGMAGCLLHVWNHALFKSLLFLSAGAIISAVHTRVIDHLGGLAKHLPLTATAFLIGAIAICGLPPLNGFLSEWLIYMGLLHLASDNASASYAALAIVVPALALAGTLALACFVKAYGTIFLGTPRITRPAPHTDAAPSMLLPMAVLALCCAIIGVLPTLSIAAIAPTVSQFTGQRIGVLQTTTNPVAILSVCTLILATLALSVAWLSRRIPPGIPADSTWSCGYVRPTSRMQYTATSIAAGLVGPFRWILRPRTHTPHPTALFPKPSFFETHIRDVVLDSWMQPFWLAIKRYFGTLRAIQQGSVQSYVMYVLVMLFILLLSTFPWRDLPHWLLPH